MPHIFTKYASMFYSHYVGTKEILIKKKAATISQNWKAKSLKQFF